MGAAFTLKNFFRVNATAERAILGVALFEQRGLQHNILWKNLGLTD